jgi:hypothetical protein
VTSVDNYMKKKILLLAIIVSYYGCKKNTTEIPEIKGVTVNLIANDDPIIFKKSVILFDDSNYLIKSPLDTFIIGYPFNCLNCGYDDMKAKAINDGKIKDVLIVSDYMKYKFDSVYTLAYYLETGEYYLFDKQVKESIKTIQVEQYAEGKPMESIEGRRFYIKNKLFLQTVDAESK